MTRSPVQGYVATPPRPRSPASVAAAPVLALAAFIQRAQRQQVPLLNEELILGDERETILQQIVLPCLLELHSCVRLSSNVS